MKRLQKKREKKHQRRKQTRTIHRTANHGESAAAQPNKFDVYYTSPDVLVLLGPLVVGEWSIPAALESLLATSGRPVPTPVTGHMLVDTGAGRTAIAIHVAEALGLHPIGLTKLHGAHGIQESPLFFARFALSIVAPNGGRLTVWTDRKVCGIPGLERAYKDIGAKQANGRPMNLIGLVGRDFLRFAKMIYEGSMGRISLEVDTKAIAMSHVVAPSK